MAWHRRRSPARGTSTAKAARCHFSFAGVCTAALHAQIRQHRAREPLHGATLPQARRVRAFSRLHAGRRHRHSAPPMNVAPRPAWCTGGLFLESVDGQTRGELIVLERAARGRPRGSYGELGAALLDAAKCGPGTVIELADRACVGRHASRYTCSRLLTAGHLVEVGRRCGPGGKGRQSAVLALPSAPKPEPGASLAAAMALWRPARAGEHLGESLQMWTF